MRLLARKCLMIFFVSLLFQEIVSAQEGRKINGNEVDSRNKQLEKTVSGKVTDDKGTGVPNASVTVKNTTIGVATKADGTFTLQVPESAKTIIVSSVGLGEREINLTSQTSYNVTLSTSANNLDEVIVVGYGVSKKADLTGSVATIKAPDVENQPFSSIDKIMQGKLTGLQSVAASGQPGASQDIIIRGLGSITASTAPLWVIDGVPINSGTQSRLATTSNPLSTINPNDIESISVLKDAAAASIYGSRAANGVIIVTTKKGRSGKTRVRFDSEVGASDIAYVNDKYRPLNAEEYFAITKEGLINAGSTAVDATLTALGYGNGTDFNWYDAVTHKGKQQQYNLSMEGGNDRTTFYMSGGHFIQEGTTINSKMSRTSGNIRLTHRATDKLLVSFNLNGGYENQRAPLASGAFGNPVLSSFLMLPSRSAYNPDGSWNFNLGGFHNTIALTELDKRFLRQAAFRGSLNAEYSILKGLQFKTTYGSDYSALEEDQYNNPFHGDGTSTNGAAYSYYTRYYNWVWTNTLNANYDLLKSGDLKLNAIAGYESQKSNGYFSSVGSNAFPPTLLLTYPATGATPKTASASISDYAFTSEFARANIGYKDKYIMSGSFRRDGSSRFGPKNRYANFWSVGASYNIDKEDFMKHIDFIKQLKLRASYGTNGNAGISDYGWAPLYAYGANYNGDPGSSPSTIGDSSLTWESSKSLDLGMDVGILNGRVHFSFDYYNKKTTNMLLSVPPSRTSGFTGATHNVGSMENKGIEIDINATAVRSKNFSWIVDFNFSHNINKVLNLPGHLEISDGVALLREGVAYKTYYLPVYAGVDPTNGDPLWYTDSSHSKTTNNYTLAGKQLLGNAMPKFFGSLTNTFSFFGVTVEAQLYYNFGNYVYDGFGSFYAGAGYGGPYNKVERVMDRWQKPGDVTDMPKYVYGGNKGFQNLSTFFLNSGDFIRLRNLQVGYTMPSRIASKIKMSNLFFYVRGTNLFTWVKDKNLPFDPEQGKAALTSLQVYIPKTLTAGVNIAF